MVIWRERKTVFALAWKFLRDKYQGTLLGILWALITPALLGLVISFIFTRIARMDLPRFPLFVISGLLPWMYFSLTLQESCSSLLDSSSLVQSFGISLPLIPFSRSLANFLNFLLGFFLLYSFFIYFRPRVLLLLPLLLGILFLFFLLTTGIGFLLAWSNVFYRDVVHLISLLLLFWFWITPVFYPLSFIPIPYRNWLFLNPLTPFMLSFQALLYEGKLPSLLIIFLLTLYTLIFYSLGRITFTRKLKELKKRI